MTDGATTKRTVPAPARRNTSFEQNLEEVFRVARSLHETSPDWIAFFREIFGVDGVARRLFTDQEEYQRFERSDECQQIRAMMNQLRGRQPGPEDREPQKMITIRLPASIHRYLLSEAEGRGISMNKLCIAKLVQLIDEPDDATASNDDRA